MLEALLRRHEGVRDRPYDDDTGKPIGPGSVVKGFPTIGVGHNLHAKPLPPEVIDLLLDLDLADAEQALTRALPWTVDLDDVRYAVLVDLCFNMGLGNSKRGLLSFKNTLRMIEAGDYAGAAKGMLHSKWATQVGKQPGQRAHRLSEMMRTGEWPTDL